jgi:Raf kinase inhibitor-like YbhB/YbcL family protein
MKRRKGGPALGLMVFILALGAIAMGGGAMALELRSTAFNHQGQIPQVHTCDGSDISPYLSWNDPPSGTLSLALICDDPDAPKGTWVHWVLYGIAPEARELAQGAGGADQKPQGALQGKNDFGRLGYGGPCPPPGRPHRYFFKLYALDIRLDLQPGMTKAQLLKAMEGHILEQSELVGLYAR